VARDTEAALTLTPALSLRERESEASRFESSVVVVAVAAAISFAQKRFRIAGMFILQPVSRRFSLSWGRGLG
jgi:hypothetical protein